MPPKSLQPAVVLVSDRTLSARYDVLFEGIFATMQTTLVPGPIMRGLVAPKIKTLPDGRARAAPLGLRRLESALLEHAGLRPDDVVCATPESLTKLLGEWTKVVAVSSSDPLGMGMSNTTTQAFWPGRLYTKVWTDRMLARLRAAKARLGFSIVAGGAGAWQWAQNPAEAQRQGIDTVFEGYFENQGPALFSELLAGRLAPAHVVAGGHAVESIRPIKGPSVLGAVELSRGCGNGCRFCVMAGVPMGHLPPATILADVQTNVAGGAASIVSTSEDFFRYGGAGWRVNFDALAGLLEAMRKIDGLRFVQIDHANVVSVLAFSDQQLAEIRRLLTFPGGSDFLWVNIGAESANGFLVKANGPGKLGGRRPDDWLDMLAQAADKIQRAGFFPVFSLVLGLPGETPDDVASTRRLVERLATGPAAVFPVFYEPVRPADRAERFSLEETMREDHLRLYRACYEINFRQIPRLFWDNQRAGGVGAARRLLVRLLGSVQIGLWRANFARAAKRLQRYRLWT